MIKALHIFMVVLHRLLRLIRSLHLSIPHIHLGLRCHHGQYPLGKISRIFNLIPARQRGNIVQQHGKVLGLVALLALRLHHMFQIANDGMGGVDFQYGLVEASHHSRVGSAGGDVLGLHVPLHRGTHAVGALDQCGGTVGEKIGHFYLLHLASQCRLQIFLDGFVILVQFLLLLLSLLLVLVVELESLLGNIDQFEFLVFRDRFDHDFIEGFREVEHLVATAAHLLGRGAHLRLLLSIGGDVINLFLILLHPLDILFQTRVLLPTLTGEESKQRHNIILVASIFNNTHLEILSKVIPKHNVFALVLVAFDLADHVETLAHETLVDNTEHLGLLEDLARHIEREILRVHHSPHELEPTRHNVLKLIVDKHALHVETNIAGILVEHILGKFKGQHSRNVQNGLAFDLPLQTEMGMRQRLIVRSSERTLIKILVFLLGHIGRRSQPDRFIGIHQFVPLLRFRHRLHLGFLPLFQVGIGLLVRDLFVLGRLLPHRNGKLHEFGIML
mmetsp:Transcript_42021/g.88179  ORF Transcript_42021/g.88179 Transcript_42021/m.88179 type:complete len:502 (-) Transcript_42021:124-1629(-)